jgi:nucleoside-diphosphate-sugar epimerase
MHIILGAGGPVSNAVTKELLEKGHAVRLVSRRPVKEFPSAEWVKTDLKNKEEILRAVKGATVIYMTAGLKYDKKIWAEEWPLIMQNLIAAASVSGARVIFFDNVYMYGPVNGTMTEDTAYKPSSKKGEIRAIIAEQLMNEAAKGKIRACIARAADFYGASSLNSFFDSMILQRFAEGKPATWVGNPQKRHSFTYVPDAGKALYLLGQEDKADNQVWHVPTAPALTGRELIDLAALAFGVKSRYSTVNKFMLRMAGLFKPQIAETIEMYYQYQDDYVFDSSKFEKAFGLQPTPYKEGIDILSKTLFAREKAVSSKQ